MGGSTFEKKKKIERRERKKRGKPPEPGLEKSWTEVYSEEQVMEEKR
jgi:hypothetical protein